MSEEVIDLYGSLRLNTSKWATGLKKVRDDSGRDGKQVGANLGDGVNKGFDGKVKIDRTMVEKTARGLRDVRTLYQASIKPIHDFAAAVASAAVKAGAASAAIGAGVGLAGAAFSLIGSLGQVAGVAPVAAVGIAGLAAVALTAKVALSGVGDAIKAKVGKAFKEISPQAQAFADAVGKIAPRLVAARNAVQGALFAGLNRDLRPLVDRYLPALTRYGTQIASVFNGVVRGAVKDALRPETARAFGAVMQAIVGVTRDVGGALRGFVPVLAQVGAAAAPVLREVGAQVARSLGSVRDRLAEAVKSGGVQEFIRAGVAALGNILGVLGNVASILVRVGQAFKQAFGMDALGLLRELTGRVKDLLGSARGKATVVEALRAFRPVIAGIAQTLKAVGPQVVALVPVVAKLATAFLKGLQPVIPVLGQLARAVGGALATVMPAVSRFAVALGSTLLVALHAITPILPTLANAIGGLLSPTGVLAAVINALAPVLPVLAEGLATVVGILAGGLTTAVNALAPALPVLADTIRQLGTVIATSLASALVQLAPMLPGLVVALSRLVVAVLPVIPPMVRFVSQALGPMIVAATLAINVVAWLAMVLGKVAAPLINLGVTIFGLPLRAMGALAKAISSLGPTLAGAGRAATAWGQMVMAAFRATAVLVISAAQWIMNAVLGLVIGILHAAGRLPGPLGAPFRAAEAAVTSFRDSANRKMEDAKAAVNSFGQTVRNVPANKTVTVRVVDRATGTIQYIQREIDGVTGKAVNIQVGLVGKGAKAFSRGGDVTGGIPGRDSVPALLMPDERVLTVAENRAYKRRGLPYAGRPGGPVAGGGGAGGTVINHYHYDIRVAGTVVAERELLDLVRSGTQRYARRNTSTGLVAVGR